MKELHRRQFEGKSVSIADIEIEGQTLLSMELHVSFHLIGIHVNDAEHLRLFTSAFNANRSAKLNGLPYRIRSSYPAEFGCPDAFYPYPRRPASHAKYT